MKVVCINNKPIEYNLFNDSLSCLKEGEIYEVIERINVPNDTFVLKEVKSSHPSGGFNAKRFRLIDNDWVEKLLNTISSEINSEDLIPA